MVKLKYLRRLFLMEKGKAVKNPCQFKGGEGKK